MSGSRRHCVFLVPGDWHARTGGYGYDRRIVHELRQSGWTVDVRHLEGDWPRPDATARATARAEIAALADDSVVLADGLAYGVLAEEVEPHARRLRWLPLVHHPLHLETGLGEAERAHLRTAETAALRHARQVVVTGPGTVADVLSMGVPSDCVTVIEPGTDAAPPSLRVVRAPGPVRLLCVATLTPRKGHAVLLEALSGLQHLDWTLDNVGSDTRDAETAGVLKHLAGPLGGRVSWHGELDDDALLAHYAAADVFVLPSLHEGYGMVVAEALMHGLPVVATRAGALARTLPPQAGLHVAPGDALALRAALGQIITDPGLRARLAHGAQAAARELPRWPMQGAALANVLEHLQGQRP